MAKAMKTRTFVSLLAATALLGLTATPAAANDAKVRATNQSGQLIGVAKYDDLTDTVCVRNATSDGLVKVTLRNARGQAVHVRRAAPNAGWSCSPNLSIPEDARGWTLFVQWSFYPSAGAAESVPFHT